MKELDIKNIFTVVFKIPHNINRDYLDSYININSQSFKINAKSDTKVYHISSYI